MWPSPSPWLNGPGAAERQQTCRPARCTLMGQAGGEVEASSGTWPLDSPRRTAFRDRRHSSRGPRLFSG
eukprot:15129140-Alexandrium_andersonii.AAC.1